MKFVSPSSSIGPRTARRRRTPTTSPSSRLRRSAARLWSPWRQREGHLGAMGAKWDSEDIKVFFDHVRTPATPGPPLRGLDKVEKVEIVDKQTAKVTFNSVYPDWSNALAGVTPGSSWPDARPSTSRWPAPPSSTTTTSPAFKIKSYDESKQVITLERNDKWWGATPSSRPSPCVLDGSALGQAFANKRDRRLDYIFSADVYQRAQWPRRRRGPPEHRPAVASHHVNASSGPLTDKAVRQAVSGLRPRGHRGLRPGGPAGGRQEDSPGQPLLPARPGGLPGQLHQLGPRRRGRQEAARRRRLGGRLRRRARQGRHEARAGDDHPLQRPGGHQRGQPPSEAAVRGRHQLSVSTVEIDKYFPEYINKKNYALRPSPARRPSTPLANVGQYSPRPASPTSPACPRSTSTSPRSARPPMETERNSSPTSSTRSVGERLQHSDLPAQ